MAGDGRIPLYILCEGEVLAPELTRQCDTGACLAVNTDCPGGWSVYRHLASALLPGALHGRFCACCSGRGQVESALDRLFVDRMRGACPYFTFVILACEACSGAALQELLQQDVMVRARYRI